MIRNRRRTFCLGSLLLLCGTSARAQQWNPERPIVLVCGSAAGGLTDIVSRAIAQALEQQLGRPIIVDNRDGREGLNAIQKVASAAPDGYTLLVAGPEVLVSGAIQDTLVPVALLGIVPFVAVAPPGVTQSDLRKKDRPSVFAPGFYPPLLLPRQGLRSPQIVNFQSGGEGIEDLLAGKIDMAIVRYGSVAKEIGSQKLNVLGVLGKQALPDLANLPPMPDIPPQISNPFIGVFAPKGTSSNIIATLNSSINRALDSEGVSKRFMSSGVGPSKATTEDFSRLVIAQMGVIPDKCKVKKTCEEDSACPRPCPKS